MYKLYCRAYQCTLRAVSYFVPWRKPELIEGIRSLNKLPKIIRDKGIQSVLIVTDKGLVSLGMIDDLVMALKNEGIQYTVYDKTVPNPTIHNIEEAVELFKLNKCEAIVAFGGGSPMDCAKGVGARIARPNKKISDLKGLLKIRKQIPLLLAIPTTAGTGSEATIAAVITDSETHEKYAMNDISLIPHYAVLDPMLTVKLPPHITSTTGMDALTHAIEAYIGKSNTRETKMMSKKAIKLIFENVYEVYINGNNLEAREKMQKASYFAGVAFTRAYVGYVHAIAHTLGGFYGTPHGLANAVILPYVLEYYGKSVYKQLAELAELIDIAKPEDTREIKAKKFIEAIKELNRAMQIPTQLNVIQ